MKKLIFLLLLSVASYGQTPTGEEQEFDYGIKNNAAQTVLVPNYVTTSSAIGIYGKIEPVNLPIQTKVLDSLSAKANKTLAGIVEALGYTPANDLDVLHKATAETITSVKTINNTGSGLFTAGLLFNNANTSTDFTSAIVQGNNSSSGYLQYFSNTGSGANHYSISSATGGNYIANTAPTGSGFNYQGQNDGTNTFTVNKTGDIVSNSLAIGLASAVGKLDVSRSVTTTYTSSLTSPVTSFARIGNTHNSGGSDQFSTLALHVSGNNMSSNSYVTLSAIQPTAANNNSEFSLALRQSGGSMLEVLRATTIGLATNLNLTIPAGTAAGHAVNKSQLDAVNVSQITITTAISITTDTLASNGLGQSGRNTIIDNGVNAINLTVNGGTDFVSSYLKHGTGAITFVQGSGRTMIQVDGTAILNGAVGSTATISSVGTTDYLQISNK